MRNKAAMWYKKSQNCEIQSQNYVIKSCCHNFEKKSHSCEIRSHSVMYKVAVVQLKLPLRFKFFSKVETGFHSRDLFLPQYDYIGITFTQARFWGQQIGAPYISAAYTHNSSNAQKQSFQHENIYVRHSISLPRSNSSRGKITVWTKTERSDD